MTSRVGRLRAEFPTLGASAFLVTTPVNVRYLVGFASSNAALLIDADESVLFTDGRYVEAARALNDVRVVAIDRNLSVELGDRLGDLVEGPVAFEASRMTVADHGRAASSGVELRGVERVVERLREVKEPAELDAVRRSAALLSQAFEQLIQEPVVGRTEVELARWLGWTLTDGLGAEGLAFEPIVASGPNAALPHHHPGERVIGRDELLLIDAGCVADSYCSDCTRTFATGSVGDELRRMYQVCQELQAACVKRVCAGLLGRDLDQHHRDALSDAGYEAQHGLGHGVGLEVHEGPRLARTAADTLAADCVVTVEPGIYAAGQGGVRIEDLVIVAAGGAEVLTPLPRDLLVLG